MTPNLCHHLTCRLWVTGALFDTKTDLIGSVTLPALYGEKRPNAPPHSSLPVNYSSITSVCYQQANLNPQPTSLGSSLLANRITNTLGVPQFTTHPPQGRNRLGFPPFWLLKIYSTFFNNQARKPFLLKQFILAKGIE
jgi:hypothetical protein